MFTSADNDLIGGVTVCRARGWRVQFRPDQHSGCTCAMTSDMATPSRSWDDHIENMVLSSMGCKRTTEDLPSLHQNSGCHHLHSFIRPFMGGMGWGDEISSEWTYSGCLRCFHQLMSDLILLTVYLAKVPRLKISRKITNFIL